MLGWNFYFLDWALRLVMIPLVAHRRQRPMEAVAWLAVIFFLPVLGTLLYFWLGEYTFRRGEKRHGEAHRRLVALDPLVPQRPHVTHPVATGAKRPLTEVAESLLERRFGGLQTLGGNRVELLQQDEVVDRLVEDIGAARHHAHLLFYMYLDDDTGWRVARALAEASERGVHCRLLTDSWASRSMFRKIEPWLVERGVEVHGLLQVAPLRRPLARLDVRNHRKLAVIDARVAYTGSTNIHDLDSGLDEGVWHQITARIAGPAALQLQLVFLEDWYMATDSVPSDSDLLPEVEEVGETPVLTFPSGPAYPQDALQHLFTEALHDARERVVLTTPYFIPDEATMLALRLAAYRGVEVDVVIPEESDRGLADAAGRAFFGRLMEAGVRIHLHPSGILHAKTLTLDDAFALVGTANFDRRSMFLNYEVLVLMHDPRVATDLRRRQTEYLERSRPVDPEEWRKRSKVVQVRDDTARLLSPLL